MIRIISLDHADPASIETLLDAAFGADRHGRTAYRLREGVATIPYLSFAAFENDTLIGSLQCWPIMLIGEAGDAHPLTLVGPVAVHPDRQRDGIGRELMTMMLARADANGGEALLLIGDPEYYGRFGFTADATGGWEVPGPVERRRLLARIGAGLMLPRTGKLGPDRTRG